MSDDVKVNYYSVVPAEVKYNNEMRILGRNMAYYLKCQEAARKEGITMPEQEEITFTNFIR